MKTDIKFNFDSVRFDKQNDIHAVLSFQAPKLDWEKKRPPICVIPVIDLSGSMQGQKLEYVKQSILKMLDHLKPGDYCGLVGFSESVYPLQKPIEVTQGQKDALKAKVGDLHADGFTNLSGGLLQGLEWANQLDLRSDMIVRVILFTDGCANAGVSDRAGILHILTGNLGKASVSAFGYGTDCDQDLLADMAKKGNGNYAFVAKPEDALTAFARELGGLLSTYAQNLAVALTPFNGHEISEVVSDVDVEQDGKKVKIKVGDLLSEELRHIVLALKLSSQSKALPREMNVLDVTVEYDVIDEQGKKQHCTEEVKGKLRFVKEGEEQKEPTKAVNEIVGQHQLVKAQIEAESMANAGNYAGAAQFMAKTSGMLRSYGLKDLGNLADKYGRAMKDAVSYSSSSGYLSSMRGGITRGASVSCAAGGAEDDLKSIGSWANNHAHQYMVNAFTADPPASDANAAAGSIDLSAAIPPEPKARKAKDSGVSKNRSKRW